MNALKIPLTFIALFMFAGCGTMSNGKKWGEDATWTPGWDRVGKAAYNAAVSPFTWGPAVGAAILQIDDWDKNLSTWAADKTPIFGSQDSATTWGNALLYASGAMCATTALLTPSGDKNEEWVTNKMKGFIVGGSAVLLSEGGVQLSKSVIHRERPNGSGNDSFPSSHATAAAAFDTLAARNVGALELSKPAEIAADIGLGAMAVGTGWARVESKRHYPSDVLAGIALGHFMSAFVNDAFLGNGTQKDISPEVNVSRSGAYVGISWTH